MGFIDKFNEMTEMTRTENGGVCYNSTGNKVLDFFAMIGGMRNRSEKDIVDMYHAARLEDKELADKIVLYARDIRSGGLGERRVGRILLKAMAFIDPRKVERNFQTFVDMGRFDDLYVLCGTPCEKAMWQFMREVFVTDLQNMKNDKPISLAAKWFKSINTSSKESRKLAKKFCTVNGITERTYRKTLAALRKYTNVTEVNMSANEWDKINFEQVPSVAMKNYAHAFKRHDEERFTSYKEDLKSGKAKINSGVLFPYDLTKPYIKNILSNFHWCSSSPEDFDKEVNQAQWNALPEYFSEGRNIVVCADVSGSMYSNNYTPIASSIGLALYAAEHNTGAYAGYYLTFTDSPTFLKIDSSMSLEDKIKEALKHEGFNTEMDRMFRAIYDMSVKTQETPEALVIVSDMEIDRFMQPNGCDNIITKWVKKFSDARLKCPKMILWNCECRNGNVLARSNNPYVSFVSGVSASSFKELSTLIDYDAYTAMCMILEKYQFV